MAQSKEHRVQKNIQAEPGWYLQLKTHQVRHEFR